jgi:hypothetical protein
METTTQYNRRMKDKSDIAAATIYGASNNKCGVGLTSVPLLGSTSRRNGVTFGTLRTKDRSTISSPNRTTEHGRRWKPSTCVQYLELALWGVGLFAQAPPSLVLAPWLVPLAQL